MVAPQITECGHIFCLICFLQHAEKSINRHNCPVCNEIIQKENLKSVKIQIFAPVQEKNEITLKLVARNKLNDVFVEIDTGQVDMTYQKFRAASYDTMTKIYNEEVQIIHFQEDHPNEDIPKDYLQKALEFLENRFSRQLKVKQQEQEKESNHLEDLTNNPKNYHFIYQEVHGLPVFLNPISYRFLLDQHLISSQLPKIIKQQVFKLETINLKDRYKDNYKLLSHIQEWEEIQFADIKMRDLLDEAKFEKFKKEIKKYKIKNDKSSPRIRKKSNQVQEKVQAYQQQEEYKFQEIKEDNLEYFPTLDNQPKISQKEEEPIQYIENQFNHSKFESWEQKFQAAPRIVQKQKEEEKQIEETYLKSDNQMDLQFTINIKQKKKKNKNK